MANEPNKNTTSSMLDAYKKRMRIALFIVCICAVGPLSIAAFNAAVELDQSGSWRATFLITLLLGVLGAIFMGGKLLNRTMDVLRSTLNAEMKLRRLMELSGDWYWNQNDRHEITQIVNRGMDHNHESKSDYLPIVGHARWDVEGLNCSTKGMSWDQFRTLLDRHQPFDRVQFDYHPQGRTRMIFESSGRPCFYPDGRFMGYEGVSCNITQKVLNERLMGLERHLLQGVLLSAPIGELASSYSRGLKGCLSLDCELMLGYRDRESDPEWHLRGAPPEFRIREAQSRAIWANTDAACEPLDGIENSSLIQVLRLRDERVPEHWRMQLGVQVVWLVLRKATEPGQAEYWMLVAQRSKGDPPKDDVLRVMAALRLLGLCLERRVFEDELQSLNGNLEHRIDERTRELTQTNSELEAFTYTVSHDLRAPLRAIDGFSNILREDYADQIPADAAGLLDRISNNARQMGGLIDGLLDFSRLLRTEVTRVEVDLNHMVEQVLESLDARRRAHVDYQPMPKVYADPVLIQQVWMNLIDNALKFSSKVEKPEVLLTCNKTEFGWEFSVKDNGAGFDMKYSDKLFNVFERLHHKKDFDGTGVGLAIVKRIIERHGGQIWADSTPGAGARFTFTLADPPM